MLVVGTLLGALLTACGTGRQASETDYSTTANCPPCDKSTTAAPVKPLRAATWSELPGWLDDDLAAAWPAFLRSCRTLVNRPTWKAVCEEARVVNVSTPTIRRFLESRLQPWRLVNADGSTSGLVTGYYEPLLRGSRTRSAPYVHPVLGVPNDLLVVDLGAAQPEVKNLRLRGRLQGNKVVPYYSRAEIVGREKDFAGRTLLWVDDAVELFFLQVQGSGRVRLTDGSTLRLAYAEHNGHAYQSIGRLLIDRGELTAEQATMPGIKQWARANPRRLHDVLNANPSYVFFREQPLNPAGDDGPNGAFAVPLTAERSIAVDPRYVPLGVPVFLATSQAESTAPLRRLVMAQDTGGAIHGAVRADLFYGFGDKAGNQAGRMKQSGQMWLLLPAGAAPK